MLFHICSFGGSVEVLQHSGCFWGWWIDPMTVCTASFSFHTWHVFINWSCGLTLWLSICFFLRTSIFKLGMKLYCLLYVKWSIQLCCWGTLHYVSQRERWPRVGADSLLLWWYRWAENTSYRSTAHLKQTDYVVRCGLIVPLLLQTYIRDHNKAVQKDNGVII